MLKIKTLRKYFWKITLIAIFIFFTAPSAVSASTIFRAPSVDGLVGYWDFNDGAGSTIAKDKSGQGHNGTLTNMDPATDWVDGKIGSGALDFDGSNDYVNIGPSTDFDNVTSFTWTGWFNNIDEIDYHYIVGKGTGGSAIRGMLVQSSTNKLEYYDPVSGEKPSTFVVPSSVWTFGAVVVNGLSLKIYANSDKVLDTTLSGTPPVYSGSDFRIGMPGQYNLHHFLGLIDEVRVYNRALSAEEITNLYNSQKKSFPTTVKSSLSKGLVGYWNFDIGAGGSTVYDMSGNAKHGTMVNMDPATDWVDGKVGSGSLDFDGSNDHINILDSPNWDLFGSNTGGATLSLWVKHNSWNTTDVYIAHRQDESNAWWIQHEINGTMWFGIYTSGFFIVQTPAGGAITDANWHHITMVKNENIYTLSLDGIVAGTVTDDSTAVFTGPLFIGDIPSLPATPVYPFPGLIDDVRVYNRALSAEEIQRLYKTTAGTKISKLPFLSKGLVGYWDFNDGAGSTIAKDKSGQGHNGTLTLMDPATDWVDGKVGSGSLDFDGSNDYVRMPATNSDFTFTGDFTMGMWIKTTSTALMKVWGTSDEAFWTADGWNWGYSNGNFVMDSFNINRSTAAIGTLHDGVWHYFVLVRNGTTMFVFVDGLQKHSFTYSGTLGNATFRTAIGSYEPSGAPGQFWNGSIDEARVYNRALSAEEIQRLYDLGNLKP